MKMKTQTGTDTLVRRRVSPAVLAAAVGLAGGLSFAPAALAVGEGTNFICSRTAANGVGEECPWYQPDAGPILTIFLPPAERPVLGSTSIVGVIEGFLPPVRFAGESLDQPDHVAFRDDAGQTRVGLGIVTGFFPDGRTFSADEQFNNTLSKFSGGVLATAIGDGNREELDPENDTTQGVAPNARAYVAAAGEDVVGFTETPIVTLSTTGVVRAALIMLDRDVAMQFADSFPDSDGDGQPNVEPVDVLVVSSNDGGDRLGESMLPRYLDALASDYDMTIIVPAGDYAAQNFPPQQAAVLRFRTVGGAPAAYNVLSVGATDLPGSCVPQYPASAAFSSRGELNTTDYFDGQGGGNFGIVNDSRPGIHIVAPGAKLRIPDPATSSDYVRGEDICETIPEPGPGGDPPPPVNDRAMSTRYAAGYVAGAVALVQDAQQKLFQRNGVRTPSVPHQAMRAMLMASATRSGTDITCWTNQSNFYEAGPEGECDPPTVVGVTQPLDTSVGAGQLDLARLHEIYQGLDPQVGSLLRRATMDVAQTQRHIPMIRNAPPSRSFYGGQDPVLGGGDPNLTSERQPIIGPTPAIPDDLPVRIGRPPAFGNPGNPATLVTNAALPIEHIGWDQGRVGAGFIDYLFMQPVTAGSTFGVALTWDRTVKMDYTPVFTTGLPDAVNPDVFTQYMEYENLDLKVYRSDTSGQAQELIGDSISQWSNTEFLYWDPSIGDGPGGLPYTARYMIRVEWEERNYYRFNNQLFVGDTEFGLAWFAAVSAPPITSLARIDGDANEDGVVDMRDLSQVLQYFGTHDLRGDANLDGVVNFTDISFVLQNFGQRSEGVSFAQAD